MSILIFSEAGDAHAISAHSVFSAYGINSSILCADYFPEQHEIGVQINQKESVLNLNGKDLREINTIWLRRRGIPNFVSEHIDESDKEVALQESKEFWKAFLFGYFPDARWVNPILAKLRAQSKIFQLDMARKVGFEVPASLFSNNPKLIKDFVRSTGKCIFKSFSPVHWSSETSVQSLYTSAVELSDLPDDVALKAAPGIFQKRIEKEFEIRVTCFGEHCIAAKLISSRQGTTPQDWRLGYYDSLIVEPFTLPSDLRGKIIKFMRSMQLEYAALDFIYSTDKNWYFLEANEGGQFLWIESYNPEIFLLKPFCDFLIGRSDWSPPFSLQQMESTLKIGALTEKELQEKRARGKNTINVNSEGVHE